MFLFRSFIPSNCYYLRNKKIKGKERNFRKNLETLFVLDSISINIRETRGSEKDEEGSCQGFTSRIRRRALLGDLIRGSLAMKFYCSTRKVPVVMGRFRRAIRYCYA